MGHRYIADFFPKKRERVWLSYESPEYVYLLSHLNIHFEFTRPDLSEENASKIETIFKRKQNLYSTVVFAICLEAVDLWKWVVVFCYLYWFYKLFVLVKLTRSKKTNLKSPPTQTRMLSVTNQGLHCLRYFRFDVWSQSRYARQARVTTAAQNPFPFDPANLDPNKERRSAIDWL